MRYTAQALFVLLAGALVGCGASGAAQGHTAGTAAATCPGAAGSLQGVVTKAGRLAGAATVYLWPPAGGSLTPLSTHAIQGRFSLPLDGAGRVAPGRYNVEAYQPGYTSVRRTVQVAAGGMCIRLPLVSNHRAEAAQLLVTVASSLRGSTTPSTVAVQAADGHTVSRSVPGSGTISFVLPGVGFYSVTLSRGSQALETTVVLAPPRNVTGPNARPGTLTVNFPLSHTSSAK